MQNKETEQCFPRRHSPKAERPDVHKIVLSIKLRPPPPPEKVSVLSIFYWFVQGFPHFGPFSGRGRKTKFCGQEFYGHPDLTTLTLQSLLFSFSLLFLFCDFPCVFVRFCALFQGFERFGREENPCFFRGGSFQKPGDHPNFRKNALGVKRPFSELSESSGVFSEQLSELEIPFSEYEIPFSEWPPTT